MRNESFCRYMALAILMSLVVVAAAQETGPGTNASSNLAISMESYSPIFFDPAFLTVYADGTVVSGTNSYIVSTQVLHSVCGELRKLGFFQIDQSALRKKLGDAEERSGKRIFIVDYERPRSVSATEAFKSD